MLDLLGVLAIAVGGGLALIGAAVYALYWFNRRRVHASASAAAAALGLARVPSPDARMELYQGATMEQRVHVATHAGWTMAGQEPSFAFQANPVVVILVRYASPLAGGVRATTVHMAPASSQTGDLRFDQWYKIQSGAGLFATQEIRDSLMRLYGPEMNPHGTGMIIDVEPEMLALRWHEPRPRKAAAIALAAVAAAVKLSQRAAFLRA